MMFETSGQIARSLMKAGFPAARADELAALARPAIRLDTAFTESEDGIPVGATKIGGRADLPDGTGWPTRPALPERAEGYRKEAGAPDNRWSWATPDQRDAIRQELRAMAAIAAKPFPLCFLAQIDFAQMWEAGELDTAMPREGVLSIFYDVIEQPWGFDPANDESGAAVLYHDGPLTRREAPPDFAEAPSFDGIAPLSCVGTAFLAPIPHGAPDFNALGLPEELVHAYYDWQTAYLEAVPEPDYRVGGWPRLVQGPMQTQLALNAAGIYTGDPKPYDDPANAAIMATAPEWMLLAQIDSEDSAGYMWGDSGRLYVWIRRDDLLARQFEKARVILQSY